MTAHNSSLERLLEVIRYLRESPDGCAWTRGLTHQALVPSMIEESHETIDVILNNEPDDHLCDELGDVLLQIVLHAEIARTRGAFSFEDVARAIVDKLVRRYPTILGDEPNVLRTAEDIDRRWQEVKAEERRRKGLPPKKDSVLDGIPKSLPALSRAADIKGRAAKNGWEWPDTSNSQYIFDKIAEELNELRTEIDAPVRSSDKVAGELGDMLFLLADVGRLYGVDAEAALRATNDKVERRFRFMEQGLKTEGLSVPLATSDDRQRWWNKAKAAEKKGA